MRVISGGCHCGNVSYEFTWPVGGDSIPVRACSCEFCKKHRGVYTSHPEGKLDAEILDGTLVSRYRFATKTAEFFVCKRCGVVPFVTSEIEGSVFAVVNVNTFDAVDPTALDSSVTDFDGELREDRLARRSRTWIRNVTISDG